MTIGVGGDAEGQNVFATPTQLISLPRSMHHSASSSILPETSLAPTDVFAPRHLGSNEDEIAEMTRDLGLASMEELIARTIPEKIRLQEPLELPEAKSESAALQELRALAGKNRVFRSFIGQGYHDTLTPGVIQRNILENPGWYTAYTPYQAEISQGRLEALLNFQTMVCDLTGLPVANASLLDEATAAAEAMHMALAQRKEAKAIFVSAQCHPQTIAVIQTRAEPLGVKVIVGEEFDFSESVCAVVAQYPDTLGRIRDYTGFFAKARAAGALAICAADPLALTLLRPPGEFGADIAIGTTQRFGVPLGFGGPHAGYLACREELKRVMPGRLVGVSKDAQGLPACRLSLQTREQHIRRDKATSNICTAQVLLAVIASMYAVYHGPAGLRMIARRVHRLARTFAESLAKLDSGARAEPGLFFDTVVVRVPAGMRARVDQAADDLRINTRSLDDERVAVAFDEAVTEEDIANLVTAFNLGRRMQFPTSPAETHHEYASPHRRESDFLTHPVFNTHHTEHEMLRYLRRLESRDLSLCHSMIPLGSCTMKLNATSEMFPISWPEFARMHPYAPAQQVMGYFEMARQLAEWLAEITGLPGVSLEPNAGSQGEYAGLLCIDKYHASRGEPHRNVCLIPTSAHGTNPASAVMAGMKVVAVTCDEVGNIDVADLREKARANAANLAALMMTYPSTHGVFEETVQEICAVIHEHGGQVYMDGANMNAQVGLTSPGRIGADVCHLNLHKTFCIPHGGGGPGMGPICVAAHLEEFLPDVDRIGPDRRIGSVSAAALGSASILPISWMYIRMMGGEALATATKLAILNANYIAHRLEKYFPVLYRGSHGFVAHECILDLRGFKKTTAEDVAKRLMDYGFHAPTLSWPVSGTLMVEPTESESKAELDRFCEAMISIHAEMAAVEEGTVSPTDNPLKNAPHTARVVTANAWEHGYSREQAAYPAPWLHEFKFWPAVGRVDNVFGDRNLVCTCPSVEETAEA
jgi:glycine dehydrogenase